MFFIKSVWRVRKHETQSYRESCVFHFSHFDLYINIYILFLNHWFDTFGRHHVKLRFTKSRVTCHHNWGKCVYGIKHHWKQSSLYSSIQKPKPAINHQPVHHCISSQRSVVCNNRNAFNVYNADHRKMRLWWHLMPNSRLRWCICQLCYPSNPWFDSV